MARNYANIACAIWRDLDFREIYGSAQRTYFLLMSQADITAAGVLAITIGRWANRACDTTEESIERDIKELVAHNFVAIDELTQELLVRTFVKWDGGYTNPKRKPVIIQAAKDVESPALRRVLAMEFRRLGLPIDGLITNPTPPDGPSHKPSDGEADRLSILSYPQAVESASRETPNWNQPTSAIGFAQVNSLSGRHASTDAGTEPPEHRVVGSKEVVKEQPIHNPQPTTPNPLRSAHGDPSPLGPIAATTEEGAEPDLIHEIQNLRPEWSARSIRRAIEDETVAARPTAIVAAAMRLVAVDPQTKSPGRIRGDGPWWSEAAFAVRAATRRDPEIDEAGMHAYEIGDLPGICGKCNLIEASRYHRGATVTELRHLEARVS